MTLLRPFFLAVFCGTVFAASANNFIHRDGKLLKDSAGKAIQLKGVNLGGWLLWEGWIWGGGFKSQSTIQSGIESAVGKGEADAFRDYVYRNFISEKDIQQIGAAGMNVVRVPINNRIFDTASCNAIGWQVLDSLLKWCSKYHVYAVLDMHAAPGGQSTYFIADPEKTYLWKSEADKQKTVALWEKIAARYKNYSIVAGYDLLNEPIPPKDADLLNLYERIIAGIREMDKNHLVILEGSNFAKKFDVFTKLPDENMAFSFHIYTWFGGKPKDKLQPYVTLVQKLNAPMWCGEWGENTHAVVDSTLQAFAAQGDNFCGWCFWTWKKTLNSYPALNEIKVSPEWKTFMKWCGKPSAKNKPASAQAMGWIREFEKAMLMANTAQNAAMMKLLSDDAKKR